MPPPCSRAVTRARRGRSRRGCGSCSAGWSRSENSGFLTDDQLLAFGQSAGVGDSGFTQCVRSGKYNGWVTKNTDAASQRGVTGTPTVLLNGKVISNSGASDPQSLTDAVNQAAGQG